MIPRSTLWLPLLLLLFLAALSFWLDHAVQGTANGTKNKDFDPESIVENFAAQRSDRNGRLIERLSAKKLLHFSGSGISELEAPHLVQMSPGSDDFDVTANRASITHETKEVTLTGQVHVNRIATDKRSVLTFVTDKLIVDQEKNRMHAPGPVNLKGPGLNVSAAAMEADSNRRFIKLFGRVRAQYQNAKN